MKMKVPCVHSEGVHRARLTCACDVCCAALFIDALVSGLFGRPYAGGEFYVGSMSSSCEAHGGAARIGRTART